MLTTLSADTAASTTDSLPLVIVSTPVINSLLLLSRHPPEALGRQQPWRDEICVVAIPVLTDQVDESVQQGLRRSVFVPSARRLIRPKRACRDGTSAANHGNSVA